MVHEGSRHHPCLAGKRNDCSPCFVKLSNKFLSFSCITTPDRDRCLIYVIGFTPPFALPFTYIFRKRHFILVSLRAHLWIQLHLPKSFLTWGDSTLSPPPCPFYPGLSWTNLEPLTSLILKNEALKIFLFHAIFITFSVQSMVLFILHLPAIVSFLQKVCIMKCMLLARWFVPLHKGNMLTQKLEQVLELLSATILEVLCQTGAMVTQNNAQGKYGQRGGL